MKQTDCFQLKQDQVTGFDSHPHDPLDQYNANTISATFRVHGVKSPNRTFKKNTSIDSLFGITIQSDFVEEMTATLTESVSFLYL